MATVQVDIWSDILCPFCYIGKRNFETALADFDQREQVEVHWHAFELDPGLGRAPDLSLPERSRQDLGGTEQQTRERMDMVEAMAARAGLRYDLYRARAVNSLDAHRLIKLAESAGLGDAMRERLMRAYTGEGAVLTDVETLVSLAGEVGLDAATTRNLLSGNDFTDAVHADRAAALALGISGVPTFVFDNRFAISGARQPGDFRQLLERSLRSRVSG
ncbi:DsbA family oxidoreductase [Nocardia crassostreae]|uniref:DsbA family oxidoreductase n=1 Tax=Nocardia crassostreae TaxID=53428 RepID=UPI0008379A72|nr:DsbA family oxidoreductase [Nocardia crassostreae]